MSARSETGGVAVPHDPVVKVGVLTAVMSVNEKITYIEGLRRAVKDVVAGLRSAIGALSNKGPLSNKSGRLALKDFGPLQDEAAARTVQATGLLAQIQTDLITVKGEAASQGDLKRVVIALVEEAKEVVVLRQQLSLVEKTVFASRVTPQVKADLRAMEMAP